jgi:hypothetical protein
VPNSIANVQIVVLNNIIGSITLRRNCTKDYHSWEQSVYIPVEMEMINTISGKCISILPVVFEHDAHAAHARMDGGLDPWLEELWPKIMAKYPLPPGLEIIPADVQYPFYERVYLPT